MVKKNEIRLFSNNREKDKEVFSLLVKEKIPFINYGPTSEEQTPILEYGYWKFIGIKQIKKFISDWKANNLPPLDL